MSSSSHRALPTEDMLLSFQKKKEKILSDLSIPVSEYKDRSPKGSVDEGIRDLIDEINTIDGLVTISSCAGRISVYLEGEKTSEETERTASGELQGNSTQTPEATISDDWRDTGTSPGDSAERGARTSKTNAPGGKGHGGRWLFVSHSPIKVSEQDASNSPLHFHDLFGLQPRGSSYQPPCPKGGAIKRFIRLQFEPLLLHILCATLPHAAGPLSAAMSSGFRESGLQSLTCLSQPSTHHPIVGVRSLGMGLQTVIGYVEETPDGDIVGRSLVDEAYLATMVKEIEKRFEENERRRERLRQALRSTSVQGSMGHIHGRKAKKADGAEWEDVAIRAQRKREEGLRRKEELAKKSSVNENAAQTQKDDVLGTNMFED